jgi:hypothetical protein
MPMSGVPPYGWELFQGGDTVDSLSLLPTDIFLAPQRGEERFY